MARMVPLIEGYFMPEFGDDSDDEEMMGRQMYGDEADDDSDDDEYDEDDEDDSDEGEDDFGVLEGFD